MYSEIIVFCSDELGNAKVAEAFAHDLKIAKQLTN